METKEEILNGIPGNNTWFGKQDSPQRQVTFQAMEIYAEQFKPKWISVEDELPPYGIKVLCLMQINPSGKDKYRTTMGTCYNGEWKHADGSDTWFKVYAWMLIPDTL